MGKASAVIFVIVRFPRGAQLGGCALVMDASKTQTKPGTTSVRSRTERYQWERAQCRKVKSAEGCGVHISFATERRSLRKYDCTLDEFVYKSGWGETKGSKPRVNMRYRVLSFCYRDQRSGSKVSKCLPMQHTVLDYRGVRRCLPIWLGANASLDRSEKVMEVEP